MTGETSKDKVPIVPPSLSSNTSPAIKISSSIQSSILKSDAELKDTEVTSSHLKTILNNDSIESLGGMSTKRQSDLKVDKTISQEQVTRKDSKKVHILPPLVKKSGKLPSFSEDRQSSVLLDNDMSVAVRRKTIYQDIMQKRKSSAFIRLPNSSSQKGNLLCNGNDQEKKSVSDQIIKDKTDESMLVQDKGRFYLALVASDQLAGGPFKNYLTLKNNELLVDYLNLWESIEITRCLTNEGGRRGACAKSFGGNGFLSCHDEWPVKKDDPYHQYHDSLRKIKKYQDSWNDFNLRFKLIQEFFSENQIIKPYDTIVIKTLADQLTAAGCNDEILALVQDHLVTKLRKELEKYYKFDSSNFYYYMSSHDENFSMKKACWGKSNSFVVNGQKRNRLFGKPKSSNLIVEAIFSPLSRRLWVAIDICEKMVFPFSLRKLSLPLLTLSSMIAMKMFIMRKRKEKVKKVDAQEALTGPSSQNDHPKKKKRFKPAAKKKTPQSIEVFYIDWEAKTSDHNQRLSGILTSLKDSLKKDVESLAPPSIDDMFLHDPSIKHFRRFIVRKFKGAEKDHLMNVANFLIAQKELENKLDCVDFSELSKGVCSSFIFCKSSILHDIDLPENRHKMISKKKSGYPTFLIFLGAAIQEWIYTHMWSNYISTMFRSTDVDDEQFHTANEIVTFKTTGFNKKLCKHISHFVCKISNFLAFLAVPSQFEEFRDFLMGQKESSLPENDHIDKLFGKGLTINPSKLPQDLHLLIEIFAYKNLLLTSRQVAKELSLDGTEEQILFDKINLIVEIFLDSTILPRLQVNIPASLAVDIMLSQKNLHISYTLFNEVTCYLFQSLLFFWKKYCYVKHVPKSSKKSKMLDKMAGRTIPQSKGLVPAPPRKKSNQVQISCSDFDRFKFNKGGEIGGFNYSITQGYRETYRAKQLVSIPSSSQASKTLKSIHSSKSSISKAHKPIPEIKTTDNSQGTTARSNRRLSSRGDNPIHIRERERLSMVPQGRNKSPKLPRMSLPVIRSSVSFTCPY